MNARVAVVLVVLLAVLGGGALLIRQQGGAQKPAAVLGQPLFKGLKASEIAAIRVREPAHELNVVRGDKGWTLLEREGFPADIERVSDLVLKAIELKIGQSEPVGDKDRQRLRLVEPAAGDDKAEGAGTLLELKAADGKPLARLVVGRKYFKAEPSDPEKALGDGRFVRLPDDQKTVYIVSDPLAQVTARSAEWVSRKGIAADKVRSLEYRAADGEHWKIERSGDNADWSLVGIGAGEKLEITKANAAAYALSNLGLADVAPKDVKPEATGLASPATITAQTFDGLTYSLKIGKLEGENLYATVSISGTPAPAAADAAKDAAERAKALAERVAREKALEAHTLLIPARQLGDVLKPRAEMLEKKEEQKK
jgi:hypothetical protein